MRKTAKKALALILGIAMIFSMLSITALATTSAVDFTDTDGYYDIIYKKDYVLSQGVTESEIVLNNAAGSRRQVLHVIEADTTNPYVSVRPSYSNMENPNDSSKYKVITTTKHAQQAVEAGYNVVGAMNTALSWNTNQPLGKLVIDGVVYRGEGGESPVGCQTYLAIKEDGTADLRASSEPLEADDYQALGLNFGFMVRNGVNVAGKTDHTGGDPRSVIGVKADGTLVVMMCDGRMSPYSAGLSQYEIGEIMLSLGCVEACNGDGGGSSSFLTKREGEESITKRSSDSDGIERDTTMAILIVNTAPDSDTFDHASLAPENDYITPGSSVTVDAIGVSAASTTAEIPSDVTWQLADSSFGTVSGGVFTSNGKVGDAVVQMCYNGAVVGEATVHVVIPETIEFNQAVMTVPFGKTANLDLTAYYGTYEVALKPADINFAFSDSAVGTLSGFSFTAVSEQLATATSSTVTATLVHDNTVTAEASISLGKGSEVIFDFEGENEIDNWYYMDYNVTKSDAVKGHVHTLNPTFEVPELVSVVDSTTGKVRNGEHALAAVVDNTEAIATGWIQYRLFYVGDYFERSNAIKLGMWVYIPEEALADEMDLHLTLRQADGTIKASGPVMYDPDYGVNGQEEAGWHYFTCNLSYPKIYFGHTDEAAQEFYIQFYNYAETWKNDSGITAKNTQGKFTIFIDDITLEYSSAADDTAPPVFSDVTYTDGVIDTPATVAGTTMTRNNATFMANVAEDTTLSTAVGLNTASIKAYIDGVQTPCTYVRGLVTTGNLTLNDGPHTIKFYAEDNNGNPGVTVKSFTVDASSSVPTMSIVPHDSELTNLPFGSLYYVDAVASDLANLQSASFDMNLNGSSTWELDHMVVAEGFTANYTVNQLTNIATVNVTRVSAGGAASGAVVSMPIRVWSSTKGTTTFAKGIMKRVWVTLKTERGVFSTTSGDTVTFGSDLIETPTEMSLGKFDVPDGTSVTVHTHTAEAVANAAATCTETGYTGRTYCDVCHSVVDWGTAVPATGHSFSTVGGVLKCTVCDELYNGEYAVDGKYYVSGVQADGWVTIGDDDYYFNAGVKTIGQIILNNHLYTFNQDGVYQADDYYTGPYYDTAAGQWRYFDLNDGLRDSWVLYDGSWHYYKPNYYAPTGTYVMGGRNYKFEGVQGKCIGAWVEVAGGNKMFYFNLHYYKNVWAEIEGESYYFDNDGYCYTGKSAVAHSGEYLGGYEFDADGKLQGTITGVFQDSRSGNYYYADDGVLFNGGLLKYKGYYFYARSSHLLATNTTWNVGSDKLNGIGIAAGDYEFDEKGRLIREADGDMDLSGTLDASDLVVMQNCLLATFDEEEYACDVNGDSVTNILDLIRLKNKLAAVAE